jgi:crotonobetainyl-CoA:carnitine CoA-transferase CaiB-like acyl-CoA transferase
VPERVGYAETIPGGNATVAVGETAAGVDAPPLEGIRVVEIAGGISAAFAARQLGGFGAEVVRVEGHAHGPGLSESEEVYLVAGKRRVEVSGEELRRLVLTGDILVEDGPPGHLAVLGLEPTSLRDTKGSLLVVSISPFGQTGPYRGYRATNIVSFAMGGIMSLTGDFDRSPLVSGGSQAQYLAGLHAFSAAVTALFAVAVHGEGDWIDISAQECAAGMLELYGPWTAYGGPVLPRMGNHTRAEWGIYPCVDGYFGVFALQRQIQALFEAVGDPELTDGPFLDPIYRLEHVEELNAKLFEFGLSKTQQELMAVGRERKVPIGLPLTPQGLLGSVSLEERGFWDQVETPSGAAIVPGRPFTGLGWRKPARLHPPGEDTEQVLHDWLGRDAR